MLSSSNSAPLRGRAGYVSGTSGLPVQFAAVGGTDAVRDRESNTGATRGATRREVSVAANTLRGVSGFVEFLTTPEFLTGAFVSGLLGSGIAYLSARNGDKRKMAHDDLKSNRQLLRETATAFSEVCSSVIEKAIDSKSVFNSVMDAMQNMQDIPDKKALEKIEYAVDLMDEAKQITTAFNNLRVVAPVPVLQKASALNAAVMALTQATTVPLAKPPLMLEAAKAFEGFTNAVRAELGLDPYTAEDADSARKTYMETLTKQMNDYIKETREEFQRYGFLEPGGVPITPIPAGDLTQEHVGKLVGCHDPQTGFNYGAKIVKIVRLTSFAQPLVELRLSHPPMPNGRSAHEDCSRLPLDYEVQLVEIPGQAA